MHSAFRHNLLIAWHHVFGLLVLVGLAPLATGQDTTSGELMLRLLVPGTFPLEQVQVRLTQRGSSEGPLIRAFRARPREAGFALSNLPAGQYRVQVVAKGLSTVKDLDIAIEKGKRNYATACMSIIAPFDRFGPPPAVGLKGKARLRSVGPAVLWVDLLSVCSGARYEIATDPDGEFALEGLS
jgi:hypothetical protein